MFVWRARTDGLDLGGIAICFLTCGHFGWCLSGRMNEVGEEDDRSEARSPETGKLATLYIYAWLNRFSALALPLSWRRGDPMRHARHCIGVTTQPNRACAMYDVMCNASIGLEGNYAASSSRQLFTLRSTPQA